MTQFVTQVSEELGIPLQSTTSKILMDRSGRTGELESMVCFLDEEYQREKDEQGAKRGFD